MEYVFSTLGYPEDKENSSITSKFGFKIAKSMNFVLSLSLKPFPVGF